MSENEIYEHQRDVELHFQARIIFGQLTHFLSRINPVDDDRIQELNRQTIEAVKDFDEYQTLLRKRITKTRERFIHKHDQTRTARSVK
jgi:hypothetical protein